MDLNFLQTLTLGKRVSHYMDGAWQVWVRQTCKESFTSDHHFKLRVLETGLEFRSRLTMDQLFDATIS